MDYFIMALLVMAENIKPFLNGWCNELPFVLGTMGLIAIVLWNIIRIYATGDDNWETKDEAIYKEIAPKLKKGIIMCFIISFVFSFLVAVTPNMKQAALIYTVPKIINNKNIQALPDNVLILFNESIKELTAVVRGEVTTAAKDISKEAATEAKAQIQEVSKIVKEEIKEKVK